MYLEGWCQWPPGLLLSLPLIYSSNITKEAKKVFSVPMAMALSTATSGLQKYCFIGAYYLMISQNKCGPSRTNIAYYMVK